MMKYLAFVLLFALVVPAVNAEDSDWWICVNTGDRLACRAGCTDEYNRCNQRCSNMGGIILPFEREACYTACHETEANCQSQCSTEYACIPVN